MTIGERIKDIRGSLSRDKFALQTCISKSSLVNYETGERTPPSDYLVKLLELFPKISPAWLLMGEGEMERGDGVNTNQILALDEDLLNTIIISVVEFTNKHLDKDSAMELALSSASSIIQLYNLLHKSKKPHTPEMIKDYITLFSKINEISNGDSDVISEIFKQVLEAKAKNRTRLD